MKDIDPKQHPLDDERWNYFMAGWELGMKDAARMSEEFLANSYKTKGVLEVMRMVISKLRVNAESGHPSLKAEREYENLRKLEYWNQEGV